MQSVTCHSPPFAKSSMPTPDLCIEPDLTKGRRSFLGACAALGASNVAPASNMGGSIFPGKLQSKPGGRVAQLRWSSDDIADSGAYHRLRAKLAAHTPNPWLRSLIEQPRDELPHGIEALVGVRESDEAGAFGTVLDFSELDEYPAGVTATDGQLTFDEWLRAFRPVSRDDFLMALPFYHLYRHTGEVVPAIQATPDAWLDGVLKSTRAMLFWTAQWIEVFRVVGNMGQQEALQLLRAYQLGRPDAAATLEELRYLATGQSLMEIINERSPTGTAFGSPDYIAGDWLHQYWS